VSKFQYVFADESLPGIHYPHTSAQPEANGRPCPRYGSLLAIEYDTPCASIFDPTFKWQPSNSIPSTKHSQALTRDDTRPRPPFFYALCWDTCVHSTVKQHVPILRPRLRECPVANVAEQRHPAKDLWAADTPLLTTVQVCTGKEGVHCGGCRRKGLSVLESCLLSLTYIPTLSETHK